MELSKAFENCNDPDMAYDLYLTLTNDGEFYRLHLLPMYQSAEKYKGWDEYDRTKVISALEGRIRSYLASPDSRYNAYNRKFYNVIPKTIRVLIAERLVFDFESEIEAGNSFLPVKEA
jgi:hypothetical protein